MPRFPYEIELSQKFTDDLYEYRFAVLNEQAYNKFKNFHRLLTEDEWRSIGIQQSRGWEHYYTCEKEPHILHFRRPRGTDPDTGRFPPDFQEKSMVYEAKKAQHFEYEADL